jgi:hypothetical protein
MIASIGNKEFKVFLVVRADLHSQDGSMADSSILIVGSIDVSWINGAGQGSGRELVFPDKFVVAVDAFRTTVQEG